MSKQPNILVAGILDTKGQEIKFLADRVKAAGGKPTILELSVGGEVGWADISVGEILNEIGRNKDDIFALDRGKASDIITEGAKKFVANLLDEGKLDAMISLSLIHISGVEADIIKKLSAIAVEQTTGTWVPVPEETPEMRERHVAKVMGIYEVPGHEFEVPKDLEIREFVFQLAYPAVNFGPQIPMLLSTVIGNISMSGKLKLLDLQFPKSFLESFQGPKFGTHGIRELLDIPERPLLNNMIKPCTGSVSYTHLDVYKRQAYDGPLPPLLAVGISVSHTVHSSKIEYAIGRACPGQWICSLYCKKQSIVKILCPVLVYPVAVSYTHLDVYKRQGLNVMGP